jgi:hypothetical protein
MIFNLFKKNKNPKIVFWSTIDGVERSAPILPAAEVIPEWFKTIKSKNKVSYEIEDFKGTVKNCPGISDFMNKGFVMSMWCDLKLNITPTGYEWRTPNENFQIKSHPNYQYIDLIPNHAKEHSKYVIKPLTPWRCKTEKGYSLLELPLLYHYDPNFMTMAGVTDTDIFHELNPQLVFKKYGEFFIPKGTPISHMIPFKREEFDLHIIKNDEKTKYWDKVSNTVMTNKFYGSYKDYQKKVSKCPFHKKDEDENMK